jgi:hypothetical protein
VLLSEVATVLRFCAVVAVPVKFPVTLPVNAPINVPLNTPSLPSTKIVESSANTEPVRSPWNVPLAVLTNTVLSVPITFPETVIL